MSSYADAIIADADDGPNQSRSAAGNGSDAGTRFAASQDGQVFLQSLQSVDEGEAENRNEAWATEESESLMMMMMDAHNDVVAGHESMVRDSSTPLQVEDLSPVASDQQQSSALPVDDGGWEEVPAEVQQQWDAEATLLKQRHDDEHHAKQRSVGAVLDAAVDVRT